MTTTIRVSIRNPKTCSSWAKVVTGVDLAQKGGYALVGEWLPGAREPGGHRYLYQGTAGILAAGYKGGSWQHTEYWVALVQVQPNTSDEAKGVVYDGLAVAGGKIIFFASSYEQAELVKQAATWGADNAQLAKARNPAYAAALFLALCHQVSQGAAGETTSRWEQLKIGG